MKFGLFVGAAAVLAMVVMLETNAFGGKDKEKEPLPSVKEIMQGCMKSGLHKKVFAGEGTDADKAKLLKGLALLAEHKAPKGDTKNWEILTKGIAEAVKSGDLKKVEAALNCSACHGEYKAKKKKN